MLNERNTLLEDDGIEEEILVEEECSVAQAVWGDIQGNIENQTDLQSALDAKQDSLTEAQLNAVNSGITASKVATYDGYADQIASKANQSALNAEATTREQADTALGTRIDNEALARQQADNGLQSQIDAITSKSDVVDVVANYAALQAYDTSTLGNNDVVKVLDDETHGDAMTYYRWSTTTQTWSYIGQEAPYYSKSQTDTLLLGKQNTIDSSHKLSADLVDDTSTTNKFVTAQDKTNWNAKQDALTAGNNINITGTTISTPAIAPEVVAELPTTGEEGKLYLTPKNYTTGTATGNPITISLGEDAGQITSAKLDGDTYQQSYEGKNLWSATTLVNGYYAFANGELATGNSRYVTSLEKIDVTAGETYTISADKGAGVSGSGCVFFDDTTFVSSAINPSGGSFTVPSGANKMAFNFFNTVELAPSEVTHIQLEKGISATTYEPYVGGVPSPNPDYPQDIKVVTGENVVKIDDGQGNEQSYPISLGSIELCKLSTYQDYIWKDGDDWKVHKNIGRYDMTGQENIIWSDITPRAYMAERALNGLGIYPVYPANSAALPTAVTSKFTAKTFMAFYTNAESDGFAMSSAGRNFNFGVKTWTSESEARADIAGTIIYYALDTNHTTDTAITDQTLIAQLEAIRTASLQNGTNTISNTATGSNLAGDMGIGYYEYDPTNRYDKWLWLDINNNYEKLGS